MASDHGGAFELVERGSDLAIRVRGPDPPACLAAAVEGLAASLAEVGPGVGRRRVPLRVDGDRPVDLLVSLVEEVIGLLDAEGSLAVGLAAEPDDRGLRGELVLVDLDDVVVHGVPPKAATWHDARLDPVGGRWEGSV
ncbi:MAG: archease, partial [Actinomycetota bacterium]|nr:archease [Actinomycetota bacterium]